MLRWQCQLPWLYQVSVFCGPRPVLMPAVWAPQVFAQSLSGLVTVSCETSLPCHVWNLRLSPKLSVLCHSVLPVSLIWKDILDVVFLYFIPGCHLKYQSEHWVFHRYVHMYSPGWCIIPFLLCVVLMSFCMCVYTYHVCRVCLAVLISFCMCVYTFHVCRVHLTAPEGHTTEGPFEKSWAGMEISSYLHLRHSGALGSISAGNACSSLRRKMNGCCRGWSCSLVALLDHSKRVTRVWEAFHEENLAFPSLRV